MAIEILFLVLKFQDSLNQKIVRIYLRLKSRVHLLWERKGKIYISFYIHRKSVYAHMIFSKSLLCLISSGTTVFSMNL